MSGVCRRPMAKGKFVARDTETLRQLDAAGQLVLGCITREQPERGTDARGGRLRRHRPRVWACAASRNVTSTPTQHPRWTRGEAGTVGDGLQTFANAVKYFA